MTRVVEWLAGPLSADERDAVLGDLAEAGATNGETLWALCGLFARRQMVSLKTWQPWAALFGLAGILPAALGRVVFRFTYELHQQLRTYRLYGAHYETGLTFGQDVIILACAFLALCAWFWTAGFVLGYLSGRAVWLTALFYAGCLHVFLAISLISGITIFLPALLGMLRGSRRRFPGARQSLVLVAVTGILTALVIGTGSWNNGVMTRWSEGAMRDAPQPGQLLPVIACWPAVYMFLIANLRQRRTRIL